MTSKVNDKHKIGFVTELTFLISMQSLCVLCDFLTSTMGLPHGESDSSIISTSVRRSI